MFSYLSITYKQWASATSRPRLYYFLRNGELLGHSPIRNGVRVVHFHPYCMSSCLRFCVMMFVTIFACYDVTSLGLLFVGRLMSVLLHTVVSDVLFYHILSSMLWCSLQLFYIVLCSVCLCHPRVCRRVHVLFVTHFFVGGFMSYLSPTCL
jgi:hypothetical protein